VGRSLCIDPA